MIYLLDTNACVSHLRSRGRSPVGRRLATLSRSDVAVCSVVRAELVYGAYRSANPAQNLFDVRTFVAPFASIPFDDAAAEEYGRLRETLARAGTPIGPNDLMIAAIALANGLTLVTQNTSEFGRVPALKIEDWEAVP